MHIIWPFTKLSKSIFTLPSIYLAKNTERETEKALSKFVVLTMILGILFLLLLEFF